MAAAPPLPAVFIHSAAIYWLEPEPAGLRAAFGEGSAARDLLLDFLPFRTGLLRLRAASVSAKQLVAECTLKTQTVAGQVPVTGMRNSAAALVEAFPCAHRLEIVVDAQWELQHLAVCTHPHLVVKLGAGWLREPTFGAGSMLRFLRTFSEVHLPTLGLTDTCFGQLKQTTALSLSMAKWSGILHFSFASLALLRSLRELTLHGFRGYCRSLSLADLAPVADQLTSLSLIKCEEEDFTDFRGFTSLQRLTVDTEYCCQFDFSAFPLSLRYLNIKRAELALGPEEATHFSPLSLLEELILTELNTGSARLPRLPRTLRSLTIDLNGDHDDIHTDDLLDIATGLPLLTSLDLQHCKDDALPALTQAMLEGFSKLESLTLSKCSISKDDNLPLCHKLSKLACPSALFSLEQLLTSMPALCGLDLWYDVSPVNLSVHDVQTLLMTKTKLAKLGFWCDAESVRQLCLAIHRWAKAVFPGAGVLWSPDVDFFDPSVAAPAMALHRDDAPEGWVVLPDDASVWEPGWFSCTEDTGYWGI